MTVIVRFFFQVTRSAKVELAVNTLPTHSFDDFGAAIATNDVAMSFSSWIINNLFHKYY